MEEGHHDEDRISGASNKAKGAVKDAAGSVTGDTKTQAEGTVGKAKGSAQNAMGGTKDAARDAAHKRAIEPALVIMESAEIPLPFMARRRNRRISSAPRPAQ